MKVELGEQEWNQIITILAQAPWNVANPLLMKLGEQLRAQGAGAASGRPNGPLEASEGLKPENYVQRPS